MAMAKKTLYQTGFHHKVLFIRTLVYDFKLVLLIKKILVIFQILNFILHL